MITRLFVLGLLAFQPMSGYAIQQYFHLNQTEQWADILAGSIYHALKKLATEGLISLQAIEQTGNRSKAIYAITASGREELQRLLHDAWSKPGQHFPLSLYAALNFLDVLPRADVLAAIDEHIAALQTKMHIWQEGERAKSTGLLPQQQVYVQLTFANGRAHIETDLHFLQALREQLPLLSSPLISLPPIEEL